MPYIDLGAVVGPQGEQGATGAQGIRGEQGLPGPNQVTNSTATPLTGVLVGKNGVVGVESIDDVPTQNSTGFATSGAVKTALDAKANQQQLAYVETDTTASRAYDVGEYFCWNGLLYRATAEIASGGTFTVNTNCEQVTVGAELQDKLQLKTFAISSGQTLTIGVASNYQTVAFLVATEGARATLDSLHYSVLLRQTASISTSYSILQTVASGSEIAVNLTSNGLTVKNNNATYGIEVVVLVFSGIQNMTFAVS